MNLNSIESDVALASVDRSMPKILAAIILMAPLLIFGVGAGFYIAFRDTNDFESLVTGLLMTISSFDLLLFLFQQPILYLRQGNPAVIVDSLGIVDFGNPYGKILWSDMARIQAGRNGMEKILWLDLKNPRPFKMWSFLIGSLIQLITKFSGKGGIVKVSISETYLIKREFNELLADIAQIAPVEVKVDIE